MTPSQNKLRSPRRDVLLHVPASAGTSPREIDVHIEELVLHGFTPASRWHIADALEAELRGLLLERGVPDAWHGSPEKLEAGPIPATRLTSSGTNGARIAHAIYHSASAKAATTSTKPITR